MTSTYGWIITRDLTVEDEPGDEGVVGPRDIAPETEDTLTAPRSSGRRAFRMYDDDGELYYTGYYAGPDDDSMFGPLDDFGAPNAGCTTIRYRDQRGGWATL